MLEQIHPQCHTLLEQLHWCTARQILDEENSNDAGLTEQDGLAQHLSTTF
jgi:hypothetical protein